MDSRIVACVLALAACGKSAKPSEGGGTAPGGGSVAAGGGAAGAGAGGGAAVKPAQPPTKAPARGAEHPVYSLVDNRLSAHLSRGNGLLLAGGSAGFAKYVRVGNFAMSGSKKSWELRQKDGELTVAKLTGKNASVFVPLTAAQARRGTLRMRVKATEAGAISVRINDNKDINGTLPEGWSTLELAIPSDQLKDGENAFQFFMKSPGDSVAWIQIGGDAPVADDGATQFYDSSAAALVLPQGGAMSWFVVVPPNGKLAGDLADGACKADVLATAEDGASATGTLTGIGSAVDLAALAGKAVRLDLTGAGCPRTTIAKAALVTGGAAPTVARGTPPKYVVFVIMDSLRADRVHAFDSKARPETPTWDKLAATSTLFMRHYVQGNESQVSHASMWTSMYLAKHKAAQMSDHLPESYVTIDDVAKKGGKYTAGVSANGYIRPARGFGTSWDQFVNHIEKSLGLRGGDVLEKGLSFVAPKKDQPWFLYLGMIDTHVTWRAKQPWMDKYDGGYTGRFKDSFGDEGKGGFAKDLTDREKDHVRALYDSNVSYQDDLMAKLETQLETWGIWDQTMLIITADHGDEQWEDGRVGHAGSEKETLIHVPLLIHYPPMFPTTKVVSGTEGIDIVPTLADVLGVAPDAGWQGSSLVPAANGAVEYPQLATSSQYENFHGGRIGSWKIRLTGTGAPQLYNLAQDPGEKKDLWGTSASAIGARLMLDPMWFLRQWNVEWKKSQWGAPNDVTPRFAADLGE